MLLKTQLFVKELFWPSFLVLCSTKNLSEQFITTHIVFWLFFCNIKLQFVRTYEADGDFFKKFAIFPITLACFLSYCWVSWHQEANPSAQKWIEQLLCKLQDQFCTNCLKVENKNFWKKVTFQVKKKHFYIFARNTEFCRRPWQIYHVPQSIQANFGASKKVNSQRLDKLSKTECFEEKNKKKQTFQLKKNSFLLLALPKMTNLKKHCLRVHEVFRHLLFNY